MVIIAMDDTGKTHDATPKEMEMVGAKVWWTEAPLSQSDGLEALRGVIEEIEPPGPEYPHQRATVRLEDGRTMVSVPARVLAPNEYPGSTYYMRTVDEFDIDSDAKQADAEFSDDAGGHGTIRVEFFCKTENVAALAAHRFVYENPVHPSYGGSAGPQGASRRGANLTLHYATKQQFASLVEAIRADGWTVTQ